MSIYIHILLVYTYMYIIVPSLQSTHISVSRSVYVLIPLCFISVYGG